MSKHEIAIVVGSLRKDSVNRKIANTMCAIRDEHLDCSTVEIAADGTISDEMLGKFVIGFAGAFADWVDLIVAGRAKLAANPA